MNLKPICDIIGFVDQRHPVKVGGMILSDLGRSIMVYTQILNQLVAVETHSWCHQGGVSRMADNLYSNSDVVRSVKDKLNENGEASGNKNVYTEYQVKAVLGALSEVLAEHLGKGEKVRVSGIGQFEVVEHPAREVYSPSKGEKIHVEASRKTKVKPAKEIREF